MKNMFIIGKSTHKTEMMVMYIKVERTRKVASQYGKPVR